jgi:membrane protease subunit (stomatin/prohibitin family)
MLKFKKSVAVGCVSSALLLAVGSPVLASDAGAFIGGVAAARVARNMRARTQAEQQQAQAAQSVAQASSTSSQSPEARIQQLDKLAAGGYITPAEYKQKKKAILDSM